MVQGQGNKGRRSKSNVTKVKVNGCRSRSNVVDQGQLLQRSRSTVVGQGHKVKVKVVWGVISPPIDSREVPHTGVFIL